MTDWRVVVCRYCKSRRADYGRCRVYYDDFMDWVQLMGVTVIGGRRATSRTAERTLRQLAEDGYLKREEHMGRHRRKYVIFWPSEKLQGFCANWEEKLKS